MQQLSYFMKEIEDKENLFYNNGLCDLANQMKTSRESICNLIINLGSLPPQLREQLRGQLQFLQSLRDFGNSLLRLLSLLSLEQRLRPAQPEQQEEHPHAQNEFYI